MTNLDKQALFGALAMHYDVGFSQDIADQVEDLHERDVQFLDIKELNDLAGEYRLRIKALIKACREQDQAVSTVRQVYASHERLLARRQIRDLWQLYRMVQADSCEMTTIYKQQLQRRRVGSSYAVFVTQGRYRKAA